MIALLPERRDLDPGPAAAPGPRTAVLIPCYNEALSIRQVVADFQAALPYAEVYVYDNNSTDDTAGIARAAGAIVRHEGEQGKGNVVRRMFADVDADLYLMVDGDGTYDPTAAPRLLAELLRGPHDMVSAARLQQDSAAYRRGHVFGNRLLTDLVSTFFGRKTTDMLSGYKAFSRRFVKSFPATSRGFEIETELMIHGLDLRLPMSEIEAPYGKRPEGSHSKLSTIRDGLRIVRLLIWLLKHEKPFAFFLTVAAALALLSMALAVPVVAEYLRSGLVPRLPTAILSASIMLVAVMSSFAGLVLDTVTHSRRELKRLFYMQSPPPSPGR